MANKKGPAGRKQTGKKGSPQRPPVRKPASAAPAKKSGGFDGTFLIKALYVVIATVCIAMLFAKFFELTDISNNFLKENKNYYLLFERGAFLFLSVIIAYFGFLHIFIIQDRKWLNMGLKLSALAVIVVLYVMAFNPALGNFGDNASYVINAKALVEKGGPYYMHRPDEAPYPKAAIGLPLILAPVYYISGIDIIKMKYVVFLAGVLSVLFFYLLFSKITDKHFAAVLAILYSLHPFVLFNTSTLMTEIPYLFWSSLALWLVITYGEGKKINWFVFVALLIALFMTYLTRTIGIAIFATAMAYLFFKLPVKNIRKINVKEIIATPQFKNFIVATASLFIIAVLWQIRGKLFGGTSHVEAFANRDIGEIVSKNWDSFLKVFSQNIFADNTLRWHMNPKDYKLLEVTSKWTLVLFITGIGMINGLLKKHLTAFYFLLFVIILILASGTTSVMVISRYLVPLTPFMIFYFVFGIVSIFELINRFAKSDNLMRFAKIPALVMVFILAYTNMSGSSHVIQKNNTGQLYITGYDNFIEAAAWCKENIPDSSLIASRKPRIFYLYSNCKGVFSTNYREKYSKEYEEEKLAQWKQLNVDYVILDAFNSSSRKNIYPIVQNNPDKFTVVQTIGKNGQCYIAKVNKL